MNIIRRIISFFKLSVDEKEINRNEINLENTRRTLYVSLVAIPVSIIHIVIFGLKLKDVSGIEQQWVVSIILSHITILIITTICSILIYFFSDRAKKNNILAKICTKIILILLLVMGAIITSFDQYVTSAITPFINTSLIVALVFLIRPLYSLIYYLAAYILFYFALAQTQLNHDILFSNQVNGLSISAIGFCLSYILWRGNLTRIIQKQEIIKQNKALFESNAEKDKFFSIIAHDLKSPFNSIMGFSDLLVEQLREKKHTEIYEYAKIILQSSHRAMDLLTNLMEWSKSQTGRMKFDPEYFNLVELINNSELLFTSALQQKRISIKISVPLDAVVFADKNMIATILRNLISNAIKFTHSEGEIIISAIKNLHELTVSVADNGVGISKFSIHKLFRIDGNYSTEGTQKEIGTGLGLILCKEFIEINTGKIWAESEEGKGSIFYFTLPLIIE